MENKQEEISLPSANQKPNRNIPDKTSLFPSVRIFIAFLTFLGVVALTNSIYSFGFALVCMVNNTAVDNIPDMAGNSSIELYQNGLFNWDKTVVSNLLAGLSWGAIVFQIPVGCLLDRFGARVLFGIMQAVAMVTTVLTPVAAAKSPWILFVIRILQGMAHKRCVLHVPLSLIHI